MIVITAMYGRHAIVDIALRQYRDCGHHVIVAGSDGDAGRALVESYGFDYIEMPNKPVSRKFNAALARAQEWGNSNWVRTGVLIAGSDNLISASLLDAVCKQVDHATGVPDLAGVLDAWELHPGDNVIYHWPGYDDEIQKRNGCPPREGEPVGSCKWVSARVLDAICEADGNKVWHLWDRARNASLDWDMMERIRPYVKTRDVRTCEEWGGVQIGWRDADAICPEAFRDDPRTTTHDPREVLEKYFESSTVERVLRVSNVLAGRGRYLTERDQWGLDLIAKHGEGRYEDDRKDLPLEHMTSEVGGCGDSYVRDEHGIPRHVPHLGDCTIGEEVEIGAFVTIDRATLEGDSTVIGDHTKVFSHAHIGHNAKVGKRCLIMNGARIGGSCVIGDDVEIGLNACIRQHLTVGDGAIIGMGAVVTHDVPAGETWAGNPARRMR